MADSRHRPPSHSDLKPILDQVPEPGVVEQRRFDAPKRPASLAGLPTARRLEGTQTLSGLPAPPPLPPGPPPTMVRVPAGENTTSGLSDDQAALLRDDLAKARDELAEERRQRRVQAEAASPATYPPPVTPAPPAAEPAPPAPVDDEPTPRAWKAALFKVIVGLGALLTAAATILGVRANTAIEPKVENNTARTRVVETAADTLTERVSKLEAFARAETKRRQCVEAQLRDALARGTGHVLTTLPAEPTGWSEQNAPKNEPRLLWKSPTWFTVQGCDAAPAPP